MRGRSPLLGLVAVLGLVSLTSCGITGRKFVDQSIGYAVTRGKVVRVDNLATERKDHFSDGVGLRVPETGCKVSLQMGRPIQVIELVPGAILVLTEEQDFILQPYDQNELEEGVAGEQGATVDAARPSANRSSQRLPASAQRTVPVGPPPPAQPASETFGPPLPTE